MPVLDLPVRLAERWTRATRHPFLDGVRDGTLPSGAFDSWLVQDHHFVGDLLRFQARLLARAPRAAQPVLAAGAVALVDELGWFEERAGERSLDLRAPRGPATEAYATLLARLDSAPVDVALTALWAVERVYLDAWSAAAPGAPPYRMFVAHWGTPEFGAYVGALGVAADDAVSRDRPPADGLAAVADVLDAEAGFWDAAVSGATA